MIRPKIQALRNISANTSKSGNAEYTSYYADLGTVGGRRIRIGASTKERCEQKVKEWYQRFDRYGDAGSSLSREEVSDAALAIGLLRKAGCERSLMSIAEEYLTRCGGGIVKKPLAEAYDLYYARFSEKQESSRQIVKNRIGNFAAAFPAKRVDEITTEMVKRYLAKFDALSAKTWNNNMTYLCSFFGWCMKKDNRFCLVNPLEDVEKKPEESKVPECAKVSEVRKLFRIVANGDYEYRDHYLYYLTLSYFCGMRTAEIIRQSVDDVRVEDGTILCRDAKGTQSGKVSFRTIPIPPTALAWLKAIDLAAVANSPANNRTISKHIGRIERRHRIDVPDNSGRHSFISYHISAYGEPKKTEGIVGTSEEMRKANYQSPATKAEGEAYFAITPDSVRQ